MDDKTKLLIAFIFLGLLAAGIYFYSNNWMGIKGAGNEKGFGSRSDPNGPYFHSIYYAVSSDGLNWVKQDRLLFGHASVPGAVIRNGIIYLYFVDAGNESDQLSVVISSDLGKTFEKQKAVIEGIDSWVPLDPHPELLDNGKIRLYYFENFCGQPNPQKKESKQVQQECRYFFAESIDGINFSEPRIAFSDNGLITDPDVIKTNNDWKLIATTPMRGSGIELAVSYDNGITFEKQETNLGPNMGVCDSFNFNGVYRTYCDGRNSIVSYTGIDSGRLIPEQGERISGEGKKVGDPSVIQLPDKTYLMFYKEAAVQDTGFQENKPELNEFPSR